MRRFGGPKFTQVLTPEQAKRQEEMKEAKEKRRKAFLNSLDMRNLDLLGYEPDYTFPGYRSVFGASVSVMLALAVLLRVATRTVDFLMPEAQISENRLLFPHDMQRPYELPRSRIVAPRNAIDLNAVGGHVYLHYDH